MPPVRNPLSEDREERPLRRHMIAPRDLFPLAEDPATINQNGPKRIADGHVSQGALGLGGGGPMI